ncbi:MAG: hypothetical protein MOB07_31015 [Acidobacteria bacterium]|nr:hypothetical protein [Acidobacteriota bacterium]
MRPFHQLIHHDRGNLMTGVDTDTGDFDITIFWHGRRYEGSIPSDVRIYVDSSAKVRADYLNNPISWPICSNRMLEVLMKYASKDIQHFDAPLFDDKTREPVPGFKVVNLIRRIECLDMKKSVISYSDDKKEILSVMEPVFIAKKIPKDIHIFRPEESHYHLIVSDELAKDLVSNYIAGVAFIRCECA